MSNMNPFLKPVHATLTNEFRPYSELREQVNGMIQDGSMDAGCHDVCAHTWFTELVETGFAKQKTEQLYQYGQPCGFRTFFALS